MLHEKFEHFQIWSNVNQHVATYRNTVAKRTQLVVLNNVSWCCAEMLRAFGQALRQRVLVAGIVVVAFSSLIGSFSNDNGDGNENVTNLHI